MYHSACLTLASIVWVLHTGTLVDTSEPVAGELARTIQNSIAIIIGVSAQNNLNVCVAPGSQMWDSLNIRPVVPMSFGDDGDVIAGWILPMVSHPGLLWTAIVNGGWKTRVQAHYGPGLRFRRRARPADIRTILIAKPGASTAI
jgi:hypothetical protein